MSGPRSQIDQLNSSSDFRSWSPIWDRFQLQYNDWWTRRIGNSMEPVYRLPESVIAKLSESRGRSTKQHRRRALIDSTDARAERAFAGACIEFSQDTIGIWNDEPVAFDLLSQPLPFGDSEKTMMKMMGKSQSQITETCSEHIEKSTATRNQLLGRSGFLVTCSDFIDGRDRLRSLWRQCPAGTRLNLTLMELRAHPALLFPDRNESDRPPDSCREFYQQLEPFLRRWNLIKFVTWDLPYSQGPLDDASPQTLCHLGLGEQSVEYTPGYFSQHSTVNLRERLQERQSDFSEDHGLGIPYPQSEIAPRRNQVASNASVFRMWIIHTAVRRRYGKVRGLPERLKEAFEIELRQSAETIKSLQSKYSAFLPQEQDYPAT